MTPAELKTLLDALNKKPKCVCTHEAGDSPCPFHGEEEGEPNWVTTQDGVAREVAIYQLAELAPLLIELWEAMQADTKKYGCVLCPAMKSHRHHFLGCPIRNLDEAKP